MWDTAKLFFSTPTAIEQNWREFQNLGPSEIMPENGERAL
jgi:hypothetical protein